VAELAKKQGDDDVEMTDETMLMVPAVKKTLEERYIDEMKKLQFGINTVQNISK
jgi:hypothetical protein